ncbi:hypothetical protein [Ornithinimicrobium cryptoxanthini]|uniref:hypothetical protein n=1 Tax=Ornithinimicrobium cryptoxanthini TaxID=2934161 RepID=UPI0021191BEF|nr:hypothetical protein [Ornithinimicrobium cryptoxanthini]
MSVHTSQPGDQHADEERAAGGSGLAVSAVIGLVVGGLLWLAWEPTTRECNGISECFGPPVLAAVLTLAAFVAVLVVRRILRLRPVFLPSLLGFVGGGGLLLMAESLTNIWPREIHDPLAPWWSWLLVGGVVGGLAHWMHQPGRRWVERIVPVAVVLGLIVASVTWVSVERDRRQLAELESVGVDTVMAPTFDDFSVSFARRGQSAGVGDFVRIHLSPHEGSAPAWPHTYLVPVHDRDLCELAVALTRESVTCVETAAGVELTDDFLEGAGVVEGGTLLLVTARVSPERDEPDEWTQQALRTGVDQRVLTTLEELRDGDVD